MRRLERFKIYVETNTIIGDEDKGKVMLFGRFFLYGMAKVLDLPAIPPVSVTETSSLAQRWDKWTKSLENHIRASGISDQKQKRAILFHLAGTEFQEIFETLPETGDDYKTALEKLTEHFNPCKNIDFERHVFRQATQKADETMDAYVTRLRTHGRS